MSSLMCPSRAPPSGHRALPLGPFPALSLHPSFTPPLCKGTDITKQLRVAVVNGIGNVRPLLEAVAAGRAAYDFIEVMTCPGGCIGGGGQPKWKGNTTLQVGA